MIISIIVNRSFTRGAVHRISDLSRQYRQHNSSNPAYKPSQNTTLPRSLFFLMAGVRENRMGSGSTA